MMLSFVSEADFSTCFLPWSWMVEGEGWSGSPPCPPHIWCSAQSLQAHKIPALIPIKKSSATCSGVDIQLHIRLKKAAVRNALK